MPDVNTIRTIENTGVAVAMWSTYCSPSDLKRCVSACVCVFSNRYNTFGSGWTTSVQSNRDVGQQQCVLPVEVCQFSQTEEIVVDPRQVKLLIFLYQTVLVVHTQWRLSG